MKKLFKNKKGFTLVELMVVVAIMGILVAVAVPMYNNVTAKAAVQTCETNARTLESAIMMMKTVDMSDAQVVDTTLTKANYATYKAVAGGSEVLGDYIQDLPVCKVNSAAAYSVGTTGIVTCNHDTVA